MAMLGLVLMALVGAGCEKDTDCKGDRFCENGKCVSPSETTTQPAATSSLPGPTPPPMPPPEEMPLPPGAPDSSRPTDSADACNYPLDTDGRLRPECRVVPSPIPARLKMTAARSRRSRRPEAFADSAADRPFARAVGLVGIMGGALVAGGASVPLFAFTGAAGVRFRSGVGFVGIAHGRIVASPAGSIQLYGVGPGVRFGNWTQLTIALTGTYAAINVGSIDGSGYGLFTMLAQMAVVIGHHFTLLVQPTIDFDASGVFGSFTGGLGITF